MLSLATHLTFARATPPLRALLTAALLSVLVGLALLRGLPAERPVAVLPTHSETASPLSLSSLPLAARGPVSAALGAGRPVYRVSGSGGSLTAANPGQRLSARFGRSGVELRSGEVKVGLSLAAVGFGKTLRTVGRVTPSASANRVGYARRDLSEWYANGPLGLEQGFTIERAPSARGAGPLTLAMALTGNAQASLTADGRSIVLSHGGRSLRYGGLIVTDARGRELPSRLALRGDRLLLSVTATQAHYPLRVDPLIQQGNKLVPNDEQGGAEAGTSVAISSDGNTIVTGGIGDEHGGTSMAGAAWVFTRSGSTWTQQGPKLVGTDQEGESQLGISVALSADGNTALVGGINDETAGKQIGAAWVFTRSGSKWAQQGAKLTGAGETPGGRFGKSVALSADGNTALVGGYFDNNNTGAAWVFTRSGSKWAQQGPKLTGAGEAGEAQFGLSVALSGDGDTALIGGPGDEGAAKVPMKGAAWVFTRSGGAWSQQAPKLTGADEEGTGELGTSVALSADGNTALAGGPGDGAAGGAFAFIRAGATWEQEGPKLAPSDPAGAPGFGTSVALTDDGMAALIGGPVDKDSTVPTGAAWQFARVGSTFTQQGSKLLGGGEAPESEFAAAVALSGDGATAVLGGPIDNGNTGAAWVFVGPPQTVPTTTSSNLTTTLGTAACPCAITSQPAIAPVLTGVAQSHRVWREGGRLARLAGKRKSRPPVGTTFSFTLNEPARVSLAFTQKVGGRKVAGKCVVQAKSKSHGRVCKRTLTPGTLTLSAHAGANRVSFQGTLSRTRKLRPGNYTLLITASSAGLRSSARSLSFTIVR